MSIYQSEQDELSIAIVGISSLLPTANNYNEFWEMLRDGREAVRCLSDEDLLASGIEENIIKNKNYVKSRSYFDDPDGFDCDFFDISRQESRKIDPQQRLMLEAVWHALEDASCNPFQTKEIIGLYAGSSFNTYFLDMASELDQDTLKRFQIMLANDKDYLSTRIAYKLNLKGPAITVQTACSTSLVAVHQACQSLLNGECTMAIAGGSSIFYPTKQGYLYQPDMILSPDGHCYPFDQRASGVTIGDGIGVVVLKPLLSAIEDNDYIHAIIRGSAINNDGSDKAAFTAPNPDRQASVVKQAILSAGLEPMDISYIEAHGTGTKLGDPIEIMALNKVFSDLSENDNCIIGSVKSNIGHTNAASGILGLIKAILCMKHRKFVPSINYEHPNGKIKFDQTQFHVNTVLKDFPDNELLNMGVSSFGFGGTNAHVVLSEYQQPMDDINDNVQQLYFFSVSAKSKSALLELISGYLTFLEDDDNSISIRDICFTSLIGRKHFPHKKVFVVGSKKELYLALQKEHQDIQLDNNNFNPIIDLSLAIAYIFSSNIQINVEVFDLLYKQNHVFSGVWDKCNSLIKEIAGVDLKDSLRIYLYAKNYDVNVGLLNFSLNYSLAKLCQSWGVLPHKIYYTDASSYVVAACFSNLIDLPTAIKIIFEQVNEQVRSNADLNQLYNIDQSSDEIKIYPIDKYQPNQNYLIISMGDCKDLSVDVNLLIPILSGEAEVQGILPVLKELHEYAIPLKFEEISCFKKAKCMPLPNYPFQHVDCKYKKTSKSMMVSNDIKALCEKKDIGSLTECFASALDTNIEQRDTIQNLLKQIFDCSEKSSLIDHCYQDRWQQADQETDILPLEDYVVYVPYKINSELVKLVEACQKQNDNSKIYKGFLQSEVNQEKWLNFNGFIQQIKTSLNIKKLSVVMFVDFSDVSFLQDSNQILKSYANLLLWLADLLAKNGNLICYFVGQEIFGIHKNDTVLMQNALLFGMSQALVCEHNQNFGGLVDIGHTVKNLSLEAKNINHSISYLKHTKEMVVAIRDSQLFIRRLKLCNHLSEVKFYKYQEKATYIITGGFSGISKLLAMHLISSGVTQVIILSRSSLSDKQREEINQINSKESSNLLHVQCDISDFDRLNNVIGQIVSSHKAIKGIFHLAGSTGTGFLRNHNTESLYDDMRAKVIGSWNLHQLTKNMELDFFILFSSATTVTGSLGQAAYLMANSFINRFSEYRYSNDLPTLAIQWGAWEGAGMFENLNEHEKLKIRSVGFKTIIAEEAFRLLDRLIRSEQPNCTVLPIKWSAYDEYIKHIKQIHLYLESMFQGDEDKSYLSNESVPSQQLLLLLKMSEAKRYDYIKDFLKEKISIILGIDKENIIDQAPFTELGLDSFSAIELNSHIESLIHQKNDISSLFNYSCIEKLSNYLLETISKQLSNQSPELSKNLDLQVNINEILDFINDEYQV